MATASPTATSTVRRVKPKTSARGSDAPAAITAPAKSVCESGMGVLLARALHDLPDVDVVEVLRREAAVRAAPGDVAQGDDEERVIAGDVPALHPALDGDHGPGEEGEAGGRVLGGDALQVVRPGRPGVEVVLEVASLLADDVESEALRALDHAVAQVARIDGDGDPRRIGGDRRHPGGRH